MAKYWDSYLLLLEMEEGLLDLRIAGFRNGFQIRLYGNLMGNEV